MCDVSRFTKRATCHERGKRASRGHFPCARRASDRRRARVPRGCRSTRSRLCGEPSSTSWRTSSSCCWRQGAGPRASQCRYASRKSKNEILRVAKNNGFSPSFFCENWRLGFAHLKVRISCVYFFDTRRQKRSFPRCALDSYRSARGRGDGLSPLPHRAAGSDPPPGLEPSAPKPRLPPPGVPGDRDPPESVTSA